MTSFKLLEDELNKDNPDIESLKEFWQIAVRRINGTIGDSYRTHGLGGRDYELIAADFVRMEIDHQFNFRCQKLADRYNAHDHTKSICPVEFTCDELIGGKVGNKTIVPLAPGTNLNEFAFK